MSAAAPAPALTEQERLDPTAMLIDPEPSAETGVPREPSPPARPFDVPALLREFRDLQALLIKLVENIAQEGMTGVHKTIGQPDDVPVPKLPFTEEQRKATCTDPLNPTKERARVDGGIGLTVGCEEKDRHIARYRASLQEGELPVPDRDVPLKYATLTHQLAYRLSVEMGIKEWCKQYLEDVRWCLMFCHIHKCAPTCYKTQQAMEAYLCRFRYYQVVLVRMLDKPTETENIVAQGKPLRDAAGSDVDMRVVNSRDHPFVSSFHPLLQAALRCNCDVQALVSSFGPVIDRLQENLDNGRGGGAGVRRAARQSFLHTARNSCVIAGRETFLSKMGFRDDLGQTLRSSNTTTTNSENHQHPINTPLSMVLQMAFCQRSVGTKPL